MSLNYEPSVFPNSPTRRENIQANPKSSTPGNADQQPTFNTGKGLITWIVWFQRTSRSRTRQKPVPPSCLITCCLPRNSQPVCSQDAQPEPCGQPPKGDSLVPAPSTLTLLYHFGVTYRCEKRSIEPQTKSLITWTICCHAVGDSKLTRRGTTHSRDLSGRSTTRAEDAQGTPTQSHISPSILVYEENLDGLVPGDNSSSSLLLSRLELSDTKVYEPHIRARLGTASHFC